MKPRALDIVHIGPGSGGGFYCQNCVRDMGLVKALHALGHDVLFVPMYLPSMELADSAVAQAPVFYGASRPLTDTENRLTRRVE